MSTNRSIHTGTTIQRKDQPGQWTVDRRLGGGNEGDVYTAKENKSIAIKIYHEGKRPGPDQTAKLQAMQEMVDPGPLVAGEPALAWPTQLIGDPQSGTLVGFVMQRIDTGNCMEIGAYCNPKARAGHPLSRTQNESDVIDTARHAIINLSQIAHNLHAHQIVMGDINDRNLLINPKDGRISVLDCDSFQVTQRSSGRTYRCSVGRPEYTAPELLRAQEAQCRQPDCQRGPATHKVGYACIERSPDHDMFAIGVIFFKLLMNGAHPYDCIYDGPRQGEPQTLRDRITRDYYPYGPGKDQYIQPPAGMKQRYLRLPQAIRDLFERSFGS